jgi:trimethylamine--corrinoid protein Co-methyltransferase
LDNSHLVQPVLSVLTEEQKQQIHSYSLKILSEVGIRVDAKSAHHVFEKAGGVKIDGELVKIPPELVEWAISSAPESIDIFNRNGGKAFCLGQDPTRFGVGVTNLFYQEPGTNQLMPFTRQHMGIGTRLGEVLESYDLVSTIGVLMDAPGGREDLYGTLEMVANTRKPLVLLISDASQFIPVLDLLEHLLGDLVEKPCAIPYFNPVTPLVINRDTSDKMLTAIERGLPVIFSNYGMAGTTTPISAAGTLAILNAELLSGLVLGQLAKPGAAMILGSLPAFFDMKVLIDFYDPHTILMNAACAEMMAFYRIPHAGTSGAGIGWGMDLPAAGLMWLNHVTACLGKTGLSPFVGGSLGSKAFSPMNVVYANDVILQSRRFANGFSLEKLPAEVEEIAEVGPGGNFLSARSTLKNYRKAYFESQVFPLLGLEKWQDLGQPKAEKFLLERTRQLITDSLPPDDHDDLVEIGEIFIGRIINP